MKKSIFFSLLLVSFLLVSLPANAITISPLHSAKASSVLQSEHSFAKVQDVPEPHKSQTIAFALALVGVLALPIGLERYYLGYKKQGIIMTVLALTGIGAIVSWIWSIIDLINILGGSLKPADGSDYTDTL